MATPLNPNQFNQTPVKGQRDLTNGVDNVFSAIIASTETATLQNGTGVDFVNNANPLPNVIATAADTTLPAGFILRNPKDVSFVAGDRVEIAGTGTVIYLEAGAAIARGAQVEYDASEGKVITSAGTNPVVGRAFDAAAADGDLLRVKLETAF